MSDAPLDRMRKLNLGCGPVQPDGWINVDGSLRAWLASRLWPVDRLLVALGALPPTEFDRRTVFASLRKRLRWPDASIDCIYLGEVLEHFTRQEGTRLIEECFRILRPGGILRVRVPDTVRFWRNYLSDFDQTYARPQHAWTLAHERWVQMFFRDICVTRRGVVSMGHYHKWAYDEITLIHLLERCGFAAVGRRAYLVSAISDVGRVEVRDELIAEGRKPGDSITSASAR